MAVRHVEIHLDLNEAEMRAFLGPDGEPGRWFNHKAEVLLVYGRASAPIRDFHLLTSLRKTEPEIIREGLEIKVGSEPEGGPVGYAYFQHEGTRHHIIRARNAKMLRYQSGGHIVYRSSVRHPGTRPNPYLSRWLEGLFR